jgi:hypothetical protein
MKQVTLKAKRKFTYVPRTERRRWRDNRWRIFRPLNDELEFGDNSVLKSYASLLASALVASQPALKWYVRDLKRPRTHRHTFDRASLMRSLLDEIQFGDSMVKLCASMLASALVAEEPASSPMNKQFKAEISRLGVARFPIWKTKIYTIAEPELN